MDGTCKVHKKIMEYKALLYGNAIQISTLWKCKCSIVYNTFYFSSLGYGTSATTITTKDSNVILPQMGINRKASQDVVCGTAQYGSLCLTPMQAHQVASRIHSFTGHLKGGSITGQLMQMLL
jgi:hypothetical protein